MSKIIGIDLGTTNSVVSVMEGGEPKVIHSAEGRNTVPSVVDPTKNIVGDVAKRQIVVNSKNTIFSVKRLMGRKLKDKEVQSVLKWLPYEIVEGKNGSADVKVDGKTYTPQEISAMILSKLKKDAETYLGEDVKEAVITVPAYFDDAQRQATKQAGEIAGLDVKRIINEPTAAALAYGLDKKNAHTIVVYDLGGGTFDVSVLELGEGVFEVKATGGDTHLGGDDFDQAIIDYLVTQYKNSEGVDVSGDKAAMQRIRDAAEKAKIELSSATESEISLPYLTADNSGPKHLQTKITRAKLEELVTPLIEKTLEPVKSTLKDAGVDAKSIDEVILVGGMTRMPKVQEKVKEFFGKDPHQGINPDEVVAIGAAIQGAVLSGDVKDILLLDVTPLTLGLETLGGVRTALIDRNSTIPTSKSQIFSTAADNQTSVEINVLQGEREMASDNKSLGRFILDGIPPAPRGVPQVEVTFDIDANGILNVSAKDKATSKEQKITITGSTSLSKEEVEAKMKEAEAHKAEDDKKKELIEVRNTAESLIYQSEKALKDAGDKVSAEVKTDVEEKVKLAKEALEGEDVDTIKKATDELSSATSKIGEAMYSQPEQPSAEGEKSETPEEPAAAEGETQEGEVIEENK